MHVVLVEPQIPQNTGSIARTCAATNTPLHLVGPYPFEISEKKVRRAGLDYWPQVKLFEHQSWSSFLDHFNPSRCWYLSTHGKIPYWSVNYQPGDFLVFGSETKGLGKEFLSSLPEAQILTIPMVNSTVRSLNLSNAASIVLFEGLRQLHND